MRLRSLVGFILAPLLGPLALWLFMAALGGREALFWLPFMLVASYATALLLGVPAYILLRRLKCLKLWHFVACGLLLGLVPALANLVFNYPFPTARLSLVMAAFGALLGPISAAIFWGITRRGSELVGGV